MNSLEKKKKECDETLELMKEKHAKEVEFLKRVAVGEIRLGGLSRGEYAQLNPKEIRYLNSLKRD